MLGQGAGKGQSWMVVFRRFLKNDYGFETKRKLSTGTQCYIFST